MVPILRVINQWSRRMNSRLIKGWKRGNKERWVLGRWSLQMRFKKSSLKGEKGKSLWWIFQES
jgi:hypothetical protein